MSTRSDFGTVDQLHSGRWRARIRQEGRQRSIGTYPTEADAWDAVAVAQDELAAGRGVAGSDTLRVHGAAWLDARELDGVRGIGTERSRWRTHVETWPLVDAPMRTIRRSNVRAWLSTVARATSRPTAQRCLSLLRGCLDDAAGADLIEGNPAREVRLPGRPGYVEDPWTYLEPSEQRAILTAEAIPEDDRIMIAIALGTGMREGEQCSMRLEDVHAGDSEQRPRLVVRRSGGGATKAGKPRTIPLFGLGLAAVRAWLARLPSYAPNNPKRLLCPTPSGAMRQSGHPLGTIYVRIDDVRKRRDRWGSLQLAAGLRRVRWHDLRHSCASSLVASWWGRRWSLEEVCSYLGHSTILVTQKYAHIGETALSRAASVTQAVSHAALPPGPARATETPWFLVVGQPGLEPGTDGLKGRTTPEGPREVAPVCDSIVTLAEDYLVAVAEEDPRRDAIGVRLAEAVIERNADRNVTRDTVTDGTEIVTPDACKRAKMRSA